MTGRRKGIAIAAGCAVAGAIGGIAGAAAAPSSHASSATKRHAPVQPPAGPRLGGPRPGGGPVVHEDAVVLNRAGTGFITATIDNGVVATVAGDQLTLTEGIGKVTYKTVTLTIPAGAKVIRNFKSATLSDLKPGDRVHVMQSSDGTNVFAEDGKARPPVPGPGGPRGFGRRWAPGGPPPMGPGGMPPHAWPGPPGGGPGGSTTTTTSTTTS